MQPIGYYAGFLRPKTQEAITTASLPKLAITLELVASAISGDYYYSNEEVEGGLSPVISGIEIDKIGDRDRLAVIRGLCDRIEIKLMEQAK